MGFISMITKIEAVCERTIKAGIEATPSVAGKVVAITANNAVKGYETAKVKSTSFMEKAEAAWNQAREEAKEVRENVLKNTPVKSESKFMKAFKANRV